VIPYEQLCEALERYNNRRQNQQEMDQLEHEDEPFEIVEDVPPLDGGIQVQDGGAEPADRSTRDTAPQFSAGDGAEAAQDDPGAGAGAPAGLDPSQEASGVEPVIPRRNPNALGTQELELEDAESWEEDRSDDEDEPR
jgi:hypothetical protein